MNAYDQQIRVAFENLIERRQRTTNVPAALTRVKATKPSRRRFGFGLFVGLLGASAVIVLFIALVNPGSDTKTVEPPDYVTQPTRPEPTGPIETPSLLISNLDTTAIGDHVDNNGDSYGGDCEAITDTDAERCSLLAPSEDGGGRIYAVMDTTNGEHIEDVFVLDDGTASHIVDTRPAGYRLDSPTWEDGLTVGRVRWTTPNGTTTLLEFASEFGGLTSFAESVFGDLYVGVNEMPMSPEDFSVNGPCTASLLHIDAATGETTEIANGFNPRLSGDGRYLAYETSRFEGEVPATRDQCLLGTELVVRDLLDNSERSVQLSGDTTDLVAVGEWRWTPGTHLIGLTSSGFSLSGGFVEFGDSNQSGIVDVATPDGLDVAELETSAADINTAQYSRVSYWESDDVLVVAFPPEDGPEVYARYSAEGEFLSVLDERELTNHPYGIEAVSEDEWIDIILNTPGIEVINDTAEMTAFGAGPEVRIGNAHGLVDYSAMTNFTADLDEDADDEVIFALRNPTGPGFTGVLVYTLGIDGPVLVGPMSFYDEFPDFVSSVEYSDETWGSYGTQSLAITEEIRADGESTPTGRHLRTYAIPQGELEVVNDAGEAPPLQGELELKEFVRKAIDGEAVAGLLAPDAEVTTKTGEGLPDALEVFSLETFSTWKESDIDFYATRDGETQFRLQTIDPSTDGSQYHEGSYSCDYDPVENRCVFTKLVLTKEY